MPDAPADMLMLIGFREAVKLSIATSLAKSSTVIGLSQLSLELKTWFSFWRPTYSIPP